MPASDQYRDLSYYGDWVDEARRQRLLFGPAEPGADTQARVRECLGFCSGAELPVDLKAGRRWERDGLAGQEVSWSVGYGPRTQAWVLKPAGSVGALPGVVALHDQGAFKYLGKQKIAHGPEEPPTYIAEYYWPVYYGGRPFADALALEGFVVLVHDAFLWGSRRFPRAVMPEWTGQAFTALADATWTEGGVPREVAEYNFAAAQHEHVIEKYCSLLGVGWSVTRTGSQSTTCARGQMCSPTA